MNVERGIADATQPKKQSHRTGEKDLEDWDKLQKAITRR
jgi:hypothetical protein